MTALLCTSAFVDDVTFSYNGPIMGSVVRDATAAALMQCRVRPASCFRRRQAPRLDESFV